MANLALWLALNAPPPPKAVPLSRPQRSLRQNRMGRISDPRIAQASEVMNQVWDLARGYFPGRNMPVPRWKKTGETLGAVGWYPGKDGLTPVGVQLGMGFENDLLGLGSRGRPVAKRERQIAFSDAVRTLLHEWAHNFQRPETYTLRERKLIEGGAEAFAHAVAPKIVRQMGRKYRRAPVGYRPATRLAVKQGMPWIIRGQFG